MKPIRNARRCRGYLDARTALRASHEELNAWKAAARDAGQTLSSWAADACNEKLKQKRK